MSSSSVEEILRKKSKDNQITPQVKTTILPQTQSFSPKLIQLNSENIEDAAVSGIERLIKNWDLSLDENENRMNNPEEYSTSVKKYWDTYQKFRTHFDASIAFIVGDLLNRCREKFFENQDKGFKKYLETQIPFSVRLAYDLMAISKKLSLFKEKKLTMEKLRALLTVSKSGIDLTQLFSNVEDLEIKDILSFKPMTKEKKTNVSFNLGQLSSAINSLDRKVSEIFIEQGEDKFSEKQLILISSAQEKLASILSMINKNISSYQK